MDYRTLGRTGLDVSVIGIGTEYMVKMEQSLVVSMVRKAVDSGINYFDVLFADPDYRDNFGVAFKNIRNKVLVTGHLFTGESVASCQASFIDHLQRLGTEYVDIVFVSCCDRENVYEQAIGPGGHLELAQRLVEKGRARYIGFSSHTVPVAQKAVQSGAFDTLMFPINPAFDNLPGTTGIEDIGDLWQESKVVGAKGMPNVAYHERRELYRTCARLGLGLIAMKPFAAGWLFAPEANLGYNPVKLIHYALSQVGVTSVIPGVANMAQLETNLAYLQATPSETDFSRFIADSTWRPKDNCMYCSHCQPCSMGIDIAEVMRLYDSVGVNVTSSGVTQELRLGYEALTVKASKCAKCRECEERCPFNIDTCTRINKAATLFETVSS